MFGAIHAEYFSGEHLLAGHSAGVEEHYVMRRYRMKTFLGLSLSIGFAVVAIYLRTHDDFSDAAFGSLLLFAFIGGATITLHDRIKTIKPLSGEIEFAEKRIDEATDKAIAKLNEEVDRLKTGFPGVVRGADGNYYLGTHRQDEDGRRYVEYRDQGGMKRKYEGT